MGATPANLVFGGRKKWKRMGKGGREREAMWGWGKWADKPRKRQEACFPGAVLSLDLESGPGLAQTPA